MIVLCITLLLSKLHAADKASVVNPNIYTDKDGDTITILDTAVRSKLRQTKEIKASNIYDNTQPAVKKLENFSDKKPIKN